MLAHLSSLRHPSQLPVSLPDVSSATRRWFSFHQFPARITPIRCPSDVLSLRSTPRPLAFLGLATLFRLERELGVLADGFESSRSFTVSQPPRPWSFPPSYDFVPNLGRVRTARERTVLSLRRPRQSPVSLPDVSSATRRWFSFHQFPARITPIRCPSDVLSLRSTPRPLAFLGLATLFRLERELGVLADGFESSRSFTVSQPPRPWSFPPSYDFVPNLGRVRTARERTVLSLRRPRQSPVSLPDVSSATRRWVSFHQFSVRIAPFRRP